MRRREFIRAFGGAAAVWPLVAYGQEARQPPLVAVLSPLSLDAAVLNVEALRAGFHDLGYIEGKNFVLELRYGNGMPELMARQAAELVSLKPAVILTGAEAGILAVHNATSTIPIVMTV
jgi:putative tryptophan/tyrosine transport system substrate-binding protein